MASPIKNYFVGWRYCIFLGIFILLYIVGILLPLRFTPHYYTYMSRIWNWTEILIMLLALYYIVKTRIFKWRQAITAVLLGAVCLVSLFRDPRTADIIMTSICVMVTFYAACQLYEQANIDNASIHISLSGSIRYFVLGTFIAVPLAFLNVMYFSFSRQIHIHNLIHSAIFALKPAIAEEVIFRFFLLAYSYYILGDKVKKHFFHVFIYIILIVPHELLHYPDQFIKSPFFALGMCILNGLLFNLPMAILMKRKNLQMAIGMHWFIDFIRFAAGF